MCEVPSGLCGPGQWWAESRAPQDTFGPQGKQGIKLGG